MTKFARLLRERIRRSLLSTMRDLMAAYARSNLGRRCSKR